MTTTSDIGAALDIAKPRQVNAPVQKSSALGLIGRILGIAFLRDWLF